MIGSYLSKYAHMAKYAIILMTIAFGMFAVEAGFEQRWIGLALHTVVFILWFPFMLRAFGLILQNDLPPMVIDLSDYEFKGDDFASDLNVTLKEANILEDLLQAKLKLSDKKLSSPDMLKIARQVVIDNKLSAKEYFALINRVNVLMGENKHKAESFMGKDKKTELTKKLEKLKEQLKDNKFTAPPPPNNEEPGKYDFL